MTDVSFDFSEQSVPLNWNGLLLHVPPSWTPAVLDGRYLLAEDGDVPVMEVKWQRIEGRFSLEKTVARLIKGVRGAQVFSPTATEGDNLVPDQWVRTVDQLAEQGFMVKPIFWRASDLQDPEMHAANISAGRGAIVHSSSPNMAWLIQFFETGARSIKQDAARVLLSLRSPDPGQWLPWNIFGIRFQSPPWVTLKDHSFRPGRYRLEFQGNGWKNSTRLILERVGPARAVLRGASLRDWAQRYYAKELASLRAIEGKRQIAEARWQRLPGRVMQRGSRAAVRLAQDGQMILATFLLNARVRELNAFPEIDATYELVST